MTFTVYDTSFAIIGEAESIGECKRIHKKWLEDTNHPDKAQYAGLNTEDNLLLTGHAYPVFYDLEADARSVELNKSIIARAALAREKA